MCLSRCVPLRSCAVCRQLFSWVGVIMYLPADDVDARGRVTAAFLAYRDLCKAWLWDGCVCYTCCGLQFLLFRRRRLRERSIVKLDPFSSPRGGLTRLGSFFFCQSVFNATAVFGPSGLFDKMVPRFVFSLILWGCSFNNTGMTVWCTGRSWKSHAQRGRLRTRGREFGEGG